ncbi:MAG: flagellar hook-basal body complex protein [bacterium]|nr:flagellar hook-basal body complex protein [bacterium]
MMQNVVYNALAAQSILAKQLDLTAENIANINTSGFQRNDVVVTPYSPGSSFENYMVVAQAAGNYRSTKQGSIKHTGDPLHAAIRGKGFFMVQGPQGVAYTKDGAFQVNDAGQLVNASGYPILDNGGGAIDIPVGADITISQDGTISANGAAIAQLGVVEFDDPQVLNRIGENLLMTEVAPKDEIDITLAPLSLESANTNPVEESMNLIKILRTYQQAQQIIKQANDMQDSNIDDLLTITPGDLVAA